MRFKISISVLLIAVSLLTGRATLSPADPPVAPEYQVKAAFLHKFVKFVEWPQKALPDTADTITIGTVGSGDIDDALMTLVQGKRAKERTIDIKRFREPRDISFCHVLFIGRSQEHRTRQILDMLKDTNTLTVGETQNFMRRGGIINFIIVENRVRFEINLIAAERAGITISAKLLQLAKNVKKK